MQCFESRWVKPRSIWLRTCRVKRRPGRKTRCVKEGCLDGELFPEREVMSDRSQQRTRMIDACVLQGSSSLAMNSLKKQGQRRRKYQAGIRKIDERFIRHGTQGQGQIEPYFVGTKSILDDDSRLTQTDRVRTSQSFKSNCQVLKTSSKRMIRAIFATVAILLASASAERCSRRTYLICPGRKDKVGSLYSKM